MIFVMIAGASASGKTTLAQELWEKLRQNSRSCQLINMDNYYKERDVLQYPNIDLFRQEPQFYMPMHLHLQQLCDDLISLANGQSVYQKTFVFATNLYKRNEHGEFILEKIDPADIIIMEGLFAQYFANEYLPVDYPRISVNVASSSYLDIIKGRLERDTAAPPIGRGLTASQVCSNECKFVGPVFFQYTAKHAAGADIHVLNDYGNEKHNGKSFEIVTQEILEEINKIQHAMESNHYEPKKRPMDAVQMAKESQVLFHAKTDRKNHPKHEIFLQMKKRSKTFGSFFKVPIVEANSQPIVSHFNPLPEQAGLSKK